MSDIRFSGVAVYPHVVRANDAPPATTVIDALAVSLLALDGLQQCDLAAALARRNPLVADSLSTTIGDAVAATRQPWCESCNLPVDICRGHDAPLSPSERFAQNVLQRVADDEYRYQMAMMQ
jgi:hypothetical protein